MKEKDSKGKYAVGFKARGSTVLDCTCANGYQDACYGEGKRLHNACKTGNGSGHRCTVCGHVK